MRMSVSEYKSLGIKKNKYNAKKCVIDGIIFDSLAEGELYQSLKVDPETKHIDCHVPVTLPGGVRFKVDFIRWPKTGIPEAIEVKGMVTDGFRVKRRLFDQFHPLAPLKVISKVGNKWVAR